MLKPVYKATLGMLALLGLAAPAAAHFGAIIPEPAILSQNMDPQVHLEVKFLHPMEMHYMEMDKPRAFGVLHDGVKTDLLESLTAAKGKSADQEEEFTFWKFSYPIKRPGDYTFFVEPAPYWEPAEDLFIVHYTKVCVHALGLEEGWDEPLGLETEIIPLSRPYGLWTGNLFSGRVLLKGKPVPFAEVEVEYLNESPGNPAPVVAPADPFITQVIKADADGVFHYAMPRAGWWGFSALSEADWTIEREGEAKKVEIGAVFWVQTRDMR
ncbi:DUF4198 domain-containing protein [Geoalkalibacter sp.]|uniref:DUF4198 domain-containing protein n=1 Tax=Geoalkalibacter sp. TaxID=3041440 RepID=UPI00272EE3F7|nr:DUF4198 domain-containing protein [Geoalkalibacter sp.]